MVAFCLGLLAAALGTGAVLLASGAPVPAPGPILILALVAALCVNRIALFPTEHAATAEAAVLLAAVVGFRHDAVFLGPLVVALLVGPLDAFHWGQRAVAQRRAAHSRCLGAARAKLPKFRAGEPDVSAQCADRRS